MYFSTFSHFKFFHNIEIDLSQNSILIKKKKFVSCFKRHANTKNLVLDKISYTENFTFNLSMPLIKFSTYISVYFKDFPFEFL